jgi:uncharacterized protein
MAVDFLGVGWNFPVKVEAGVAHMSAYEESIRQSMWIILTTSYGERVMRPDFGSGLNDLVFSLNNSATAGLAAYHVRHSLQLWEPRIEVLEVTVQSIKGEDALNIHVEYRIHATNSRQNLVFPFYLSGRAI